MKAIKTVLNFRNENCQKCHQDGNKFNQGLETSDFINNEFFQQKTSTRSERTFLLSLLDGVILRIVDVDNVNLNKEDFRNVILDLLAYR